MADQRDIFTRTIPFMVRFRKEIPRGLKFYFRKGRPAGSAAIGQPAPQDWDEVRFNSRDRWVWPKAGKNP